MPPAFNLSQDQTLQLNFDPTNYLLLCITQSKRGLLLCEHLLDALPPAERTFDGSSCVWRHHSSAHTYRLRIFKERVLRYRGLPLRKQMGSGVLDAAAASKTAIMTGSDTRCKG